METNTVMFTINFLLENYLLLTDQTKMAVSDLNLSTSAEEFDLFKFSLQMCMFLPQVQNNYKMDNEGCKVNINIMIFKSQ